MSHTTEHPLETPWTFWFKHPAAGDRTTAYELFLHNMGTFKTVEEFWHHYVHLARPHLIQDHCLLACFRGNQRPMWEAFPDGGQVILKIRRKNFLDLLWEELLFAAIGEEFGEPEVVGVALSVRQKEDTLSVWLKNINKSILIRLQMRIRAILNLDETVPLEVKSNAQQLSQPSKSPAMTPIAGPAAIPPMSAAMPALAESKLKEAEVPKEKPAEAAPKPEEKPAEAAPKPAEAKEEAKPAAAPAPSS